LEEGQIQTGEGGEAELESPKKLELGSKAPSDDGGTSGSKSPKQQQPTRKIYCASRAGLIHQEEHQTKLSKQQGTFAPATTPIAKRLLPGGITRATSQTGSCRES
jgi:hypothetical protein